jgi:Ca-activated chloride channel family protein
VTILASHGTGWASAPAGLPAQDPETASISPSEQHEVDIASVAPGQEMASFQARLTEGSTSLAKDVAWRLKDSNGNVVFSSTATSSSTALQPGLYEIQARYGAIVLDETFTLLEGNAVNFTFVLNAGALRVLPRVPGVEAFDLKSQTRIFALSGKAQGKLVDVSALPGEIINLTAGQYRIESRMLMGNAVAVTDVKVKPGVISAVEIDHHAGLARLAYVGDPNSEVTWEIRRGPSVELSSISGLNASVLLRPGKYTAVAHVGSEQLTASFLIEDGQSRDIMLGN